MTSEELLNKGIYYPKIIDLRIIVYLKLGFEVLLLYREFIAKHVSHVLLMYQPNYLSDINIPNIIKPDNLCICSSTQQILINFPVYTIYIGANQISELKTYILMNYENKN